MGDSKVVPPLLVKFVPIFFMTSRYTTLCHLLKNQDVLRKPFLDLLTEMKATQVVSPIALNISQIRIYK